MTTQQRNRRIARLERFYQAVRRLTSNHGCVTGRGWAHDGTKLKHDDYAVVFPSDLGRELEKINKRWWIIKPNKGQRQ